jgi:hypothetical protein
MKILLLILFFTTLALSLDYRKEIKHCKTLNTGHLRRLCRRAAKYDACADVATRECDQISKNKHSKRFDRVSCLRKRVLRCRHHVIGYLGLHRECKLRAINICGKVSKNKAHKKL